MSAHRFEVYATRFDSTGIVDELVPARNLSFSMPLNDHGEASFDATVEPGKSFWRPSLALPVSGILIARDGVPVWSGWVTDERPSGPRSFSFTAREWGHFFTTVPPVPWTYTNINDALMFRHLIDEAQAIPGQNVAVQTGTHLGGSSSDRTINPWDATTVEREFRAVADADGGPEWYFDSAGTLDAPIRQLVLGDRLGHTTAQTVLEYVEDTQDYDAPDSPPMVSLLSSLYPGDAPVVPVRRRGGNVIAQGRTKSVGGAATVTVATGSGDEAAQIRSTATATALLGAGWPRMTAQQAYSDVTVRATLDAHARADLAKAAGIPTGWSFVTLDGDPTADWTQTPRGSTVRAIVDTDVYGAERPVGGPDGFDARCLGVTVRVPDSGDAQIEWGLAEVLSV